MMVLEIVKKYLKEIRADGLCNERCTCRCLLNKLVDCRNNYGESNMIFCKPIKKTIDEKGNEIYVEIKEQKL